MGLLTGSYFVKFAKQMKLQMHHKLMSAQTQLARIQKQMDAQEKMLTSQQQNMEMMMKAQMQQSIWAAATQAGLNPSNPMAMMQNMNMQDQATQMNMYAYQQAQSQIQYNFANAQSVWSNYFEGVREATLEPLKNMETRLTSEIETIKNRMDTYQMMEETGEKIKQDGRKDFMPSQGG